MNASKITALIPNRVHVLLLGLVCSLAVTGVSHAMSGLTTISIEPEWPASCQPGSITLYRVTATRVGQGLLEVSLTAQGLPEGATASFATNPLRFTGRRLETLTTTLVVTCPNVTPTDCCPFTVTGSSRRTVMCVTNSSADAFANRTAWDGPMLALDRLSDGKMGIRGRGYTGSTYQIEMTTDLARPVWTLAGSTTADGNGRFIFTDAPAQGHPACFYRAVTPAPAP